MNESSFDQVPLIAVILIFSYESSPAVEFIYISAIINAYTFIKELNVTSRPTTTAPISQFKMSMIKKLGGTTTLKHLGAQDPAAALTSMPITSQLILAAPKQQTVAPFSLNHKTQSITLQQQQGFTLPPTKEKTISSFYHKNKEKKAAAMTLTENRRMMINHNKPPKGKYKFSLLKMLSIKKPVAATTTTTTSLDKYNNFYLVEIVKAPETTTTTTTIETTTNMTTTVTNCSHIAAIEKRQFSFANISFETTNQLSMSSPTSSYSSSSTALSSCPGILPISTVSTTNETEAHMERAQRIWDQDITVYEDLDHVVEWIGDGKRDSNSILAYYMAHFDFKDVYLVQAFRNLCSKLSLKGETQQIDRVLVEFSTRYFECNPKCIFGTPDVIHAIVYSLLLLNTDLHVAEGDYKKMSRSAFVRNTMNAIYIQLDLPPADVVEEEQQQQGVFVDHRTTSGLSFQSTATTANEWMPLHRTPSNQSAFSTRSSTSYAQSVDSSTTTSPSIPRTHSSNNNNNNIKCAFGSKAWQMEIKFLLKLMYSNIRHHQINNPTTLPLSSTGRVSAAFKRSVGTIIWKGARDSILGGSVVGTEVESSSISSSVQSANASSVMQYQSVASHLQTELPTSYTSNAPYYKEGMVVRKHLLEKTNQKAKHRDWRDCFMVIERDQLRMYKLDATSCNNSTNKRHTLRNTLMPRSTMSFSSPDASTATTAQQQLSSNGDTNVVVGGGDWMSHAELMGVIDLKHTLANALPSGYSRQRQHAFALQQPNGAVYLFQVGSADQVHEWTSVVNYWAGRQSNIGLVEGVSSMEYGWGDCLNSNNYSVMINEWEAPLPSLTGSMLDEETQLSTLLKHVQDLSTELDRHRDIKLKMETRFHTNTKLFSKAMTNWENKSQYLLHEIIKYQNYCDAIEKSLALQAKFNSSTN